MRLVAGLHEMMGTNISHDLRAGEDLDMELIFDLLDLLDLDVSITLRSEAEWTYSCTVSGLHGGL
jgi:hypothetical protein